MKQYRITEYYDLFQYSRWDDGGYTNEAARFNTYNDVAENEYNANIADTNTTNPFRGFSNEPDFAAANPFNSEVISDKKLTASTYNNIHIEDDGTVSCMPPNVSVPYWSKVIFKTFNVIINNTSQLDTIHLRGMFQRLKWLIPETTTTTSGTLTPDSSTPPATYTIDSIATTQSVVPPGVRQHETLIEDMTNTPIFLKFDEYPSFSKVVLSSDNRYKNNEVVHTFGYQHSAMEPIKLYLSISASKSGYDEINHTLTNTKINREELERLLSGCYFSIEWIYEPYNTHDL